MVQLKNPAMAAQLRAHLEEEASNGHGWVVYDTDNPITTRYDLHCFRDSHEASTFAREYQQIWNWHEALPINSLISGLKELEKTLSQPLPEMAINKLNVTLKTINVMNLNNLENLKEEMKGLGFADKLIAQMEEQMKKDVSEFKLHDTVTLLKGQLDVTLHFKQSGQSDFYYFNKFEVAQNQGKVLEEGQKYMVITPGADGKNTVKKMDDAGEALDFFKKQKGDSELAMGKDPAHKTMLAKSENGKVNFVDKDFRQTFNAQSLSQTFWVEKGKGFSAEQAVNLVQGRSVYRDDLLTLGGVPFKAWMNLDLDKPRDRYNNLNFNQYHDPAYGFDLDKILDKFNIKETEDPAKRVLLEASIKNGNRPLVTAVKEGQEVKVLVEAVPRYMQLNMYKENGKPEKREQFLKESALSRKTEHAKGKEKELSESQGMRI